MNNYLEKLVTKYIKLSAVSDEIQASHNLLLECIKNGGKILTCGNGGSAADSEHIVGELMKGFRLRRELRKEQKQKIASLYPEDASFLSANLQQAIPAISLVSTVSLATAFANDVNPDFIFAQQVFGLGKRGDALVAISTSGNSKNVVLAAKIAKTKGVKVVSLTGKSGGELNKHSDAIIHAPASDVLTIQEYHLPIYHCLCSMLEAELYECNSDVPEIERVKGGFIARKKEINDDLELIVFDFDGVFTDNKVYTSQDGTETVVCDRRDSLGINMLKKLGIQLFVLSKETNPVVVSRARKMGINVTGGCHKKKEFLEKYFQENDIHPKKVLYMGNDINDLEAMKIVGCSVTPYDAHPKVKEVASVVLKRKGGDGAVRELCEMIQKKRRD